MLLYTYTRRILYLYTVYNTTIVATFSYKTHGENSIDIWCALTVIHIIQT